VIWLLFSLRDRLPTTSGLDDRFTFSLKDMFRGMGIGDLAVVIDYEIPIIHLKRRKIFPILSRRRSNGTAYWAFDAASN
jgi:hypothetical protein